MSETFPKPRRRAIVQATAEILIDLCKGTEVHCRIVSGALPDDARVVGCGIDPYSGSVHIVIESETFALIEAGTQLPVLSPTTFQRVGRG
jgi:hypothetical protein